MAIQRTPISQFVQAAHDHAAKSASSADVNKDGKISREEQRRLPADLQDNVTNWREATGARVVGVRKFVDAFGPYVAYRSARVDRNGDGLLTKTDARGLPKDLRDNFASIVESLKVGREVGRKTHAELGREALERHIEDVLFNPDAEAGRSFRMNVIDGSLTGARARKIKTEMLAEARSWSADGGASDWEKVEGRPWQAPGEVTYVGALWGLYSEVRFRPNELPTVYVEID